MDLISKLALISLICCLDDSARCAIQQQWLSRACLREEVSVTRSSHSPNTNLSRVMSCLTASVYSHMSSFSLIRVHTLGFLLFNIPEHVAFVQNVFTRGRRVSNAVLPCQKALRYNVTQYLA